MTWEISLGLLLLAGLIALAWFGGRPLLRAAEQSFWSLNALAVQPVYALFREGLRHIVGGFVSNPAPRRHARLYAAAAAGGDQAAPARPGHIGS